MKQWWNSDWLEENTVLRDTAIAVPLCPMQCNTNRTQASVSKAGDLRPEL
jgi:hypothetical protein